MFNLSIVIIHYISIKVGHLTTNLLLCFSPSPLFKSSSHSALVLLQSGHVLDIFVMMSCVAVHMYTPVNISQITTLIL